MSAITSGLVPPCDIPPESHQNSSLPQQLGNDNLHRADGNDERQQSGISSKEFDEMLEELKFDASIARQTSEDLGEKKKEVYKFETDWAISNVCWSNDGHHRLALTSFIEEYTNLIQVVRLAQDEPNQELESQLTFEHPYPATRVSWCPNQLAGTPLLLATTADYLRLWRISENPDNNGTGQNAEARLESLLNSHSGSKLCAPLTSFDWSLDGSTIVTSSVDTTCAVWDIVTASQTGSFDQNHSGTTANGNLKTQLVAHEHHVYDVSWSTQGSGRDVIVTCSADGSVRLFDLRNFSTSTVLHETDKSDPRASDERPPLVRVSCSKTETQLVATFAANSRELIILDTRKPGQPLCLLNKHMDNINSISWSSQSAGTICSGANDQQALIWQISEGSRITEPLLAYRANGKINACSWSPSDIWVAIGYRNRLELLRV